jgi:RNA 2',3'-cyclic 3'-phosphodiesterase
MTAARLQPAGAWLVFFSVMSLRLFTAIVPPASIQTEIAELEEPLDAVRWLPPDNIHLTLRFIGETDAEKLDRFEEVLGTVKVEPFILPVQGTGIFPTRGPARVIWAGTAKGHPRLFQLRKQVDEALLRVDVSLEMRSFHPHFTVARIGDGYDTKQLAAFLEKQKHFEAPPFRVSEFQLIASELQLGQPPVYRMIRTFPLA